jgi:D-alanyl-D-alanine carboxypeptidase (penicillin-binding protein 5/6)
MEDKTKIAKGILLSLIPLFVFSCFVFVTGFYFSEFSTAIDGNSTLAALTIQGRGDAGITGQANEKEYSDTGEEMTQSQGVSEKELELKSAFSIKIKQGLQSEILFEKASDVKLPIASLTKLMSAVICLQNYDLQQKVLVSKEADSMPPMHTDIKEGQTYSVGELLNIMLVESSNKAVYALSEIMGPDEFVLAMNDKATELGLKNSFFADPTGLSQSNISTAQDLALLAEYIINNFPEISQMTTKRTYSLPDLGEISNTNKMLDELYNVALSKTGFTNYANGCLLMALATPDGGYNINVVLGADDRFLEMEKIINSQQ